MIRSDQYYFVWHDSISDAHPYELFYGSGSWIRKFSLRIQIRIRKFSIRIQGKSYNLTFCYGIFVLDPDSYLSVRIRFRIRLLIYISGSTNPDLHHWIPKKKFVDTIREMDPLTFEHIKGEKQYKIPVLFISLNKLKWHKLKYQKLNHIPYFFSFFNIWVCEFIKRKSWIWPFGYGIFILLSC